jgi:predicted nucleic acid-binding protein
LIQKWLAFEIQDNTVAVLQSALRIKDRYPTSCRDAAILAAAKAAGCMERLSEGLTGGFME